jgi:hypothetical protein
MALVPQIVDAVKVPVIAAGGIGDARGVAAALSLGADGPSVWKITVQPSPLTNLTIVLPIAIDRTAEGCFEIGERRWLNGDFRTPGPSGMLMPLKGGQYLGCLPVNGA